MQNLEYIERFTLVPGPQSAHNLLSLHQQIDFYTTSLPMQRSKFSWSLLNSPNFNPFMASLTIGEMWEKANKPSSMCLIQWDEIGTPRENRPKHRGNINTLCRQCPISIVSSLYCKKFCAILLYNHLYCISSLNSLKNVFLVCMYMYPFPEGIHECLHKVRGLLRIWYNYLLKYFKPRIGIVVIQFAQPATSSDLGFICYEYEFGMLNICFLLSHCSEHVVIQW